jgi:glycosyltransferase involved in cell wall biosynthesis
MKIRPCAAGKRKRIALTGQSPRENKRQSRRQSAGNYSIIVHSHLRWDWVWQRPQQFLSRLSKKRKILFVEEPASSASLGESRYSLRALRDYPNVYVLQTTLPSLLWRKRKWVDQEQRRLVQEVLAGPVGNQFRKAIQWFYDPMAATAFAGQMNELAIVYDCMDQLSQFRGAPPELILRERRLLALADVVFAGGPKIQRAKVAYNSNCHSFGCGVDEKHFSLAHQENGPAPAELSHLQGPTLGFFGVVDERMDYELIAMLADAEPNWNLVLIGPRTKVEESALPQRPNLHWLGARDYAELPSYARKFDVCLMPFALNEATEYINPTKALEYMATGRPIVSSAIEDVMLQFSHVVSIANSHQEFLALCRAALRAPDGKRIQAGIELARQNSWEAIVRKLEALLAAAVVAKQEQWEGEAAC